MKIIKPFLLIILFILVQNGQAQGFINLNFESAQIVHDPSGGYPESSYASNAIPGWTAYISGVPQTDIIYNSVPLSAPSVTLQGTNSPYYQAIHGQYSMMLWGEFNPLQLSFKTNSAAIGQTGQIPISAQSLLFWGAIGGMQVTFNGQPLTFFTIGSTTYYNIYGTDISAFAGQTGELLFLNPNYGYPPNGGPATIDNIQFLTSSVPEPSTLALGALGGLLLGFRRWRIYSR